MVVKIKKLSIENFKGIKSLTIEPNGKNLNIYGDNGTGKTTIYDAWLWLLFDKDSNNRSDFEIKPLQLNGEPVHNIVTSVEAELEVDGKTYTFKKTLSENWTKKRGQTELSFTGHKLEYYINGVPKRRKDYVEAVSGIINEKVFKILSSVTHFNEFIDWKERRSILLKLCTNKSDLEIAKENPQFSSLVDPLSDKTIDEYMSYLKSTRKKINQDMKDIPVRIDELKKRLTDNRENINVDQLQSELDQLKKQRSELMSKGTAREKINELNKVIQQKLSERNKQKSSLMAEMKNEKLLETKILDVDSQIKELQKKIEELRKEWYETRDQKPDISNTCPCCGQRLPEDKVKSAIAEFNKQKAQKLEEISSKGKELKSKLDAFIKEKEKLIDEFNKAIEFNNQIRSKIEALDKEPIPEMQELENLKVSDDLDNRIKDIDNKILEIENKIVGIKTVEEITKRINELEEQEKQLAIEFAEVEESIKLVEDFIVYKINLIENSINEHFGLVKFKLFKQLINGGIEETCETMVNGIPYRNLNNGMRINAGLDIIKTLQKFYDANIPIFIDNAESVNELIDMGNTQIIRLVVSKDKELKFEEV